MVDNLELYEIHARQTAREWDEEAEAARERKEELAERLAEYGVEVGKTELGEWTVRELRDMLIEAIADAAAEMAKKAG